MKRGGKRRKGGREGKAEEGIRPGYNISGIPPTLVLLRETGKSVDVSGLTCVLGDGVQLSEIKVREPVTRVYDTVMAKQTRQTQ